MNHSILIIDDDQRNIFALSAVLKAKGFNTLSSPRIEEAFLLLKYEKGIGVILLDMMMPGIDGYEGIALLRGNEVYNDISIIAVTAQAMSGDRERCLAAGADDYISKPVDVAQLFYLLDKHLN
jgi:CheY-like chemotaxis protein